MIIGVWGCCWAATQPAPNVNATITNRKIPRSHLVICVLRSLDADVGGMAVSRAAWSTASSALIKDGKRTPERQRAIRGRFITWPVVLALGTRTRESHQT